MINVRKLEDARTEWKVLTARPHLPSTTGDGGGTYDSMEDRVERLEGDAKEIKSDLKAIRIELAEMKGKLSGMPSTFQMIGVFATMNGLLLAGATLVIAASRYLFP